MTRAHEFSRLAKEKLYEVFDSVFAFNLEDATPKDVGKADDSEKGEEGKGEGTGESS